MLGSLGAVLCTALLANYLACNTTLDMPGYTFLGPGRCEDRAGNTSTAYACTDDQCPRNADECAAICAVGFGCTGFEMRTDVPNTTTSHPVCCVLMSTAPHVPQPSLNWTLLAGLQPNSGRVVVNASGNATAGCCYKRDYPKPNPPLNPVKVPGGEGEG